MRRSGFRSLPAWAVLLLAAAPVAAHKHPCVHTHSNQWVVTCATPGAACIQNGVNGTCTSIQNRFRVWCDCVIPKGGGGGCIGIAYNFFDDQGAGVPGPGSSVIYLAASDPLNFATVNIGIDAEGPEWGPEDAPVQGTFTLEFGSFTDPANVPVTVSDISLSFVDIAGEGTNLIYLRDGAFQQMVYDAELGTLETPDDGGLELELHNDLGAAQPVRAFLSGQVDPDGSMYVFVQAVAPLPLFGDGFETADASLWSLAVGVVEGVAGWVGLDVDLEGARPGAR